MAQTKVETIPSRGNLPGSKLESWLRNWFLRLENSIERPPPSYSPESKAPRSESKRSASGLVHSGACSLQSLRQTGDDCQYMTKKAMNTESYAQDQSDFTQTQPA